MDAVSRLSESEIGGPAPLGILAGTRVRTCDGTLPVDYLEPGDRIVTRAGLRRLLSISVARRKGVALIRICASTMGHDRPDRDLLLTPDQAVMIRDWRATALYGAAAAAVPARRLADGAFVVRETHLNARLYTLRFAEDEVIYAEGLELACPALETATA